MEHKELLKAVQAMGFPLLEPEEYDLHHVLGAVVKSQNVRLWEGFPVLLRNACAHGGFNVQKVVQGLTDKEKNNFFNLLYLSHAVFRYYALSEEPELAVPGLQEDVSDKVLSWYGSLERDESVVLGGVELSLKRMQRLFQDYYLSVKAEEDKKQLAAKEELTLEYAMSQVLSPKQKELFRKKLNGDPFTKTEREYFSRVVRKKVLALANDELHRLAKLIR